MSNAFELNLSHVLHKIRFTYTEDCGMLAIVTPDTVYRTFSPFKYAHVMSAVVTSEMVRTPTSVSTRNLLSNLLLSLGTLPQSNSITPNASSSSRTSAQQYTYLVNPRKKSDFTLKSWYDIGKIFVNRILEVQINQCFPQRIFGDNINKFSSGISGAS